MTKRILPDDPAEAVKIMIEITGLMMSVMEQEAHCIRLQSEEGMKETEILKEKILPEYQQAAQEFSQRAVDFKAVDPSLLDELQEIQSALGAVARENQFYLAS